MKEIKIFFSWQSDITWNKKVIERALAGATGRLNKEYLTKEIRIKCDEATRGVPGSPDIVHEIIQKIEDSDIFIGDVTPIIKNKDITNSNVMFELGYATNYLGWYRIIMLFNTAVGSFDDDRPFDIHKNRTTPFNAKEGADDSIIGNLEKTLFDAIKLIIDKDPPKKSEAIKNPELTKRCRDIENIEWVFSNCIHIPTWDNFFQCYGGPFYEEIFTFYDIFTHIYNSSFFFFYDKILEEYFCVFAKNGESVFSHAMIYFQSNRNGLAVPITNCWNSKQHEEFNESKMHAQEAYDAYRKIIMHIQTNYIEIDLDSLSQEAWRKYKE